MDEMILHCNQNTVYVLNTNYTNNYGVSKFIKNVIFFHSARKTYFRKFFDPRRIHHFSQFHVDRKQNTAAQHITGELFTLFCLAFSLQKYKMHEKYSTNFKFIYS